MTEPHEKRKKCEIYSGKILISLKKQWTLVYVVDDKKLKARKTSRTYPLEDFSKSQPIPHKSSMNCTTKWKGIEIIWITDIDKIKIKILGIFILRYWKCKNVLRDSTRIMGFIPDFRKVLLAKGPKQPVSFFLTYFWRNCLGILLKCIRAWFVLL